MFHCIQTVSCTAFVLLGGGVFHVVLVLVGYGIQRGRLLFYKKKYLALVTQTIDFIVFM